MRATSPVYQPWNSGLGDAIATINLLANRAFCAGPVQLARRDRGALHAELLAVFQPTGIHSVPGDGDTPLNGHDVWAADPWPTTFRWLGMQNHQFYCTHFDGISSAADKNPPPADVTAIKRFLRKDYGLPDFDLGPTVAISDAVRMLSGAAFFVGCDSGFSHLAHAVGTPTFILEYKLPIVTTHRNKRYIHCAGAGDFIDHKLPAWANYRRFIGTGL